MSGRQLLYFYKPSIILTMERYRTYHTYFNFTLKISLNYAAV